MTHSPVRAAARLTAFFLVTGSLLPVYLLAYPFGRRARRTFAWSFYRSCVALTGLTVRVTGHRYGPGTLFVANHVSYLDIPVLASLSDGLFVAKTEVRDWPVFGFLARIGRTVFVSRRATKVSKERLAIAHGLADGDSVFLFPEGSSSDGSAVLPFRPGLLSAVRADPDLSVPVQPVSIIYGPIDDAGKALSQAERDGYAWYGDMELASHLWGVFGRRRRMAVSVHFHPPRMSRQFEDARQLAAWAQETVSDAVRQGLAQPIADRQDQPVSTGESPTWSTSAP